MDHRQWQMNQGSQPNYVQNLRLGQRRSNDGNLSWPINQQVQWPQGAQSRRDVNQQIPQGNLTDIPVQLQQWQLQQYLNNRSVGGQNQSGQFAGGEPMHNQSWQRNTSLQLINDNVVNQVNHGRGIHQVCTSTNYSQASNQQVHQVSVPLQEWHGILSSHTNERSCQLPAAHQRNAFTVNQAQFIRQSGNVENPGTSGGTVNYSASPHFATTQSNTLHHDNFPVRCETEQLFTRRLSDGYQQPNPVSEEPAQFLSDPNISPQLLYRYELMQQLKNKVLTSVPSDHTKTNLLPQARPRRKNKQRTNPESNTPQLVVDTSFGNTCVQSPASAPMPSPGVAPVLSPGSAPMLSPGAVPRPSCNQYSAPPMSRPPSASSSYLSHPGTAPMQRPPSAASSHHSQNQGQDLHVGSLSAVSHVRRLSRASSQGQQHCLQQPPSEVGRGQSAASNSSRSSTPQAANDPLTDNQGGGQQASIFTSFLSGIREDIQNLKGLTLEKLRSSKQILKDRMHSLHIHLQDEQEGSGIISHSKITLYNTAVQEMEALMLTLQNEIAEREDEEAMKMVEMILSGDDNNERTSAQVGVETNQMVGTEARRKSQDHAASIHTSSSQHVIQQPTPEPLPVQPGVPNVQSSVQRTERSMSVQKVGSRVVDRRSSGASKPGDVRPMRPESRESSHSDKRREVRPQSRQSGCISACSNISSDVQVISAASFPGRQEKVDDYDREYERELILEAIEHYSLSPLEDVSSSSEIEGDNPPEYVVMDEDDIRCWYEFVTRSTSPDVMEKQQPSLVISNVQSLSHWEEGDTNSTGVEQRGSTHDTVPALPVDVSAHSLPISEPIMHGTSSNNDRSDVEDSKTCVVGEPIPGEIFRQFRSLSPAHDTTVGGETGQVNSNTTICDPTLSTEPDNAARMEAMLSRINHFQDYLTNVVDITPPSTPDRPRLRSESPPSKSSNTDVNTGSGVLPGKEAVSLRRLFSQVVDRDYSIDSGTDTQQHGNAAQKEVSDDVNSMMNNSELLKGVVNEDLNDKAVQAMTVAVSKKGHNNAVSKSGSGQESGSVQTTAEASRLPEYGKMFEAIESDSEDEVSESVNLEDIPEDDESSEESLPEITHQSWRKRNDMRRRRRLGSSPSVVLSSAVTMSDKDRKMITSVWNNDRTAAQRNQTRPNDFLSSSTTDKDDTHGKGQMAQDSVHDTSVPEKDNSQCNKTSSKAANETFPEEQSQIGSSEDNYLESAEEKGLNSTSDQEANETGLPGLNGKTESSQVRNQIISDGFTPQSVVDNVVKLQENQVEKVACVTTECEMEMQETCPLVNSESSEAVISISDSSNDTKSAEPCTNPLITVTDLVTVSACTKTIEPVKMVSETDAGVVSCESDVDIVGTGGKSAHNSSLPSADSLASTEEASRVDTSGEMNSMVKEISAPNNVESDIGSSVSSALPQSQGEVDNDIISQEHEHEDKPDDKCASSTSESRPEVLSSTLQNTFSETSDEGIVDKANPLPEPEIETNPCIAGLNDDFDHSETRSKSDKGLHDQATASQSASDVSLPHLDVDSVQPDEPITFDASLKTEPSVSEQTSETRIIDSSVKSENVAPDNTQLHSEHGKLADVVMAGEPEGTEGKTDNVLPAGPDHVDTMIDEKKTLGTLSGETDDDKLLTQIVKANDDSLFLDFEPKEKPKDMRDITQEILHSQPDRVENMVDSECSIGGHGNGVHQMVKRSVSESDGEKPLPRLVEHNDDSASVDVGGLPDAREEGVLSDEGSSSDYNESEGECDNELVFAIAEYFKNSSHEEDTSSNDTSIATKSEGIEVGEEEELMGDLGPEEEFCFIRGLSMVSTDSNLTGDLGPEEHGFSRRTSVVSTDSIPANATSLERESLDHVKEESSAEEKSASNEEVPAECTARSDSEIPVSAHISFDASARVLDDKSSCSKENEPSEKPGLSDKSKFTKIGADAEQQILAKEKVSSPSKPKQDATESEIVKEKASSNSKPTCIDKTKEADTEQVSLMNENISSRSKPKSKQADTKSHNQMEEKTSSESISETHQTDATAERLLKENYSSQSKLKASDKVEKDSGSKSKKPERENALSCLEKMIRKEEADCKSDGTDPSDRDINRQSDCDYNFEVKTLDELRVEEPAYAQSPRISRRGRWPDLPRRGRGRSRGSHRRYRSRSPPTGYFNDDMDIRQNVSEQRGDRDLRESYRRSNGDNYQRSRHWHRDDQHHEYRRSHRDADDSDNARDFPLLSPERLGNALRLVTAFVNDRPPVLSTPDEYRSQRQSGGERFNIFHPRGRPGGMRLPPPSDRSWLPERRFDSKNRHEDQRKQPLLDHECVPGPGGQCHLQDDRLFHPPRESVPRDPFEHIDRARQRLSFRNQYEQEEMPRQLPRNEGYRRPPLDTLNSHGCVDQRPGPNQGLPCSGISQERTPRVDLPLVGKLRPLDEERPRPPLDQPLGEERPQPLLDLPFREHEISPVRMPNNLQSQPEKRFRDKSMQKSPTKGFFGQEKNFSTGSVTLMDREQKENMESNDKEGNRQIVSSPSILEPWYTSRKETLPDLSQNKMPDLATNELVSKPSASQKFVESKLPDSVTATSEKREHFSISLKPDENKKLDSVTPNRTESGQHREMTQERVDRGDTLPGKQPDTVTGKDRDSEKKDSKRFNQDSNGHTNACVGGNVSGSIDKPTIESTSEKLDGVEHKSKTSLVKTKSKPLLDSREEMQNWLNMGLKDDHPRKKSASKGLIQSSKQEKTLKEGQQTHASNVVAHSSEGQSKPVTESERCKDKELDSVAKKLLATKPIGTFCSVTEKDLLKGAVTPPQSNMSDGVQNVKAYLSDYMKNPGKSKPKSSASLQGLSFRKKPPEESQQKSLDVQDNLGREERGVKYRHKHRHGTDEKNKERKSGGREKIRLKGKVLEGNKHRKQETRAKEVMKESSVGGVKGRKGKCKESDALKGQIKRHSSGAPDKSQSRRGEAHGKKKIKKISLERYKEKKKMAASALSDSEEGGGKSKEKTLDAGAFSLENEAKLREQIVASQARISALVNKRRQVEIIPHISLGKRNDQGRQHSTAVDDSDSVKQNTLKGEQVSHVADLSICNRGDKNPKSVVTKIVCSGKKKTSRSEVKCLSSSNRKVTSPDPENDLKQKVDKRGKKPGPSETQETEDVKKRRTSRSSSIDKSEGSSSSLNQESNVAKNVLASVGIIDLTGSDSESVQETKERADRGCLEGSAVRTNAAQASRQGKEIRAKKGALVSSQPVQESKQETTSKSSSTDEEVTCSSSGQELKKAGKEESSRSSSLDRGDLASSGQNQESKKTKQGKTSSSSSVEGDDLTSSTLIRETKKAKMGETSRSLSADKVDTIGSKSESKKLKKERSDRSPEAFKRKKKGKKPHSYLSSCSDVSSSSLEHTISLSRSRSRSRERRSRNRYRSPFSPGRFVGRRWSPNRRSRSRSHGRRPRGRSRSRSPSSRRRITRGRRSLTPLHQMHRSRSPPLRRLSPYRRLPSSPYRRSPSPRRLPYRRSLDRSPINSHDWLFGQRSPSPRYRKLHSRSPSPYRRKRRRSFSPQRRPRSRMSRNRSRSVSPRSWSEARSDSPTTIGSQSPRSDVDGSPMHIDLSSYRRAEMALSPDKPWRPPGTHPRDRNPGNVESAPPQRYDFPENLHGEPVQGGWSRPPPGYNPRLPLPPAPFHPAAPTYYITGTGFQHPYGGQPIVSMPSHSGSPMDPMQPHSHHQRNEMDNMQTGPDSNLPHFSQLLGAPLYNEGPPSHRQLDFSIPPPESQITGPEDGKGKPELISQHSNRPNISKNRDPRLGGSLQNVATVQTTAGCVQKQSEDHTSCVKVIKENLNQPITLVNPNKPGISEKTIKPGNSDESNKPGISDNTNKPGPLEKSNRPGTSEKLIEKVTPEKKNSPVKAKSDHIPGIMSPNDNHLEINPRTSFLEGGSSQEAVDCVSITIDNESSWDKLPLHDCTDEAGRPTETYGYSDEQYRRAFCKIEFGWPVQSTLRRKYLEKHIWDNPNAYKDNQEQESDMLSEERKPGKRQKKTARKSFVTASLGHSLEEPNNESLQEVRNEELKKLKTMRTEVLGSLLNAKNMEEKVKLKGLLENVKKDIEKLEEKGKRSGMGKHVTTVGKASANKSAVALAQRLATGMGNTEMERTESTSSTSIASASQVTSAVGLGRAVTARASLLDSTPGTCDHSETSRTGPTAGHVTSAFRSASTLLFGNTPRTSENPPISRSTSSSISSVKAILLDTSTEVINNFNIGAASNAKPETKPELVRLGSQSNLSSGASNKTTAFGPDKPEAKKLANSASSCLKPTTSQKPDTSGTETKPMITKSFFSGLGLG